MSTPNRTALARDIVTMCFAVGFVGLSFGAIAVASGLPVWAVVGFSLVIFAGGSQFLALALVASPVAAIVGGLLLNARHFPMGLAVSDVLSGPRWRRLVGAHLMVDEAVAFAMAQSDPARRRFAYWLTGGGVFLFWQLGTVLGILVGGSVGDPAQYGLDAAFPAAMLVLILPRLRSAEGLRVGVAAGLVAVVASFFVPAGLPVLLGLVGLVLALGTPASAPPPSPPPSPPLPSPPPSVAPDTASWRSP